jgi:lysosomal Pro-X carboxypeptidase
VACGYIDEVVNASRMAAEKNEQAVGAASVFNYTNIDALNRAASEVAWNNVNDTTRCVNFDGSLSTNATDNLPFSWDI